MTDTERQKIIIKLVATLLEASNEVYNEMKSTILEWQVVPPLKKFLIELIKYTDEERKAERATKYTTK